MRIVEETTTTLTLATDELEMIRRALVSYRASLDAEALVSKGFLPGYDGQCYIEEPVNIDEMIAALAPSPF